MSSRAPRARTSTPLTKAGSSALRATRTCPKRSAYASARTPAASARAYGLARDIVEVIADPSLVEIVGNKYDPISSPNDPLFFFHHINLYRMWMSCQLAHADQAPYYGYPEDATLESYCWAHLLESNLGGHYPFFHLLEGQRGPLKVRDVFDLLNFESAPYEYDTLL